MAFFALAAALTATASAEPVDDRDRQTTTIETAYAPVPKAGVVADAMERARAGVASSRDLSTQDGNPLWAVPLSALAATRDRPLFTASRRPPAPVTPAVAAPLPKAVPAAPAPPELPPLALIGTIVSPGSSIAILQNSTTQAVTRVRTGEEDSGWWARSVEVRSVVLEKGAQSVTLRLPEPGDGSVEQTAPHLLLSEERRGRH